MAIYQFTLNMPLRVSYDLLKQGCMQLCTIKSDNPSVCSFEVATKWRLGKGSLPFVFTLQNKNDVTEVTVCSDDKTLTGALSMMGKNQETIWDLADKEFSDLIDCFKMIIRDFPLTSGKPYVISAIPCDDGIGQESINRGKNVSLGRAAVGGALFGSTGAVLGGLSGSKINRTQTRNVFSQTALFKVLYSNGRILEREVKKPVGNMLK